jgi:hypothetical protein
MEHVTEDHAGEKNPDLGDDQKRCRDLDKILQRRVYGRCPVSSSRRETCSHVRSGDMLYFHCV